MTKYYLEKYNAFDRTIIEEALLGVSYAEIARKYNLPYYNIPKIINSLKCPTSSNYDIALYSAIMMEQSLANIQIIDYDLQNSVTNYIKAGYSFLEIAILLDSTEENVKNIFSSLKRNPETKDEYNTLKNIYTSKVEKNMYTVFKRLVKLEEQGINIEQYSNSKTYKEYCKYKKRKDLLYTFINYDTTLENLANVYNVDYKTLCLYLKNEDLFAEQVMNPLLVKKFYNKANYVLTMEKEETPIKQNTFHNSDIPSKGLNRLYPNLNYYFKIILTFKLSFEEFAYFVHLEPSKYLYDFIINNCKPLEKWAIRYNFDDNSRPTTDFSHYEQAKKFDHEYAIACLKNDAQVKDSCLKILNDYEFKKIIAQRKNGNKLTEEQKRTIFLYRLKYALSFNKLKDISGYNLDGWKVPAELLEETEKLNAYNEEISKKPTVLKKTLRRKEQNHE